MVLTVKVIITDGFICLSFSYPGMPHAFTHIDDKILYICNDTLSRIAAPVAQLIEGKLRYIHRVKIHRPDGAVGQHVKRRRHIAGGNGVQHLSLIHI